MKTLRREMITRSFAIGFGLVGIACTFPVEAASSNPDAGAIKEAFKNQSIDLASSDIDKIKSDISLALEARCAHGPTGDNSKAKFSAIEIAGKLNLNTKTDTTLLERVNSALKSLPCFTSNPGCDRDSSDRCGRPIVDKDWDKYYDETLALNQDSEFLKLVGEKSFSPVKMSWEDIGRYENSVWGDRISDVGIWVRKSEDSANSAQLALSVRRDNNFRDKVLMVPAEKIKVHIKNGERTKELTLKERLNELELTSEHRDNNVIVSNQFAIVPVPSRDMKSAARGDHPPRSAFNFSIYPYGSTNYVITDVIEGSSDAVVGPGTHQYLYANIDGQKAPFTASRAEDRSDLIKLESDLRAQGMDVDVQRYYLIQIPLKKDVSGVGLSNMGTPPLAYKPAGGFFGNEGFTLMGSSADSLVLPAPAAKMRQAESGLSKVAIGHGEVEGEYNAGSGFRGKRADEPIRVTVVYFVTPVGKVTKNDMENFTKAFEKWDESAIWGGSFVTKES